MLKDERELNINKYSSNLDLFL